jgi:hypothetical protein
MKMVKMLALATENIVILDINSAYLNSKLNDEIYMEQLTEMIMSVNYRRVFMGCPKVTEIGTKTWMISCIR